MSFNNIIPAWVILGDSIIKEYKEGLIDLKKAEEELDKLGVPQSMKDRLYKDS
jgi:hypothetical protein